MGSSSTIYNQIQQSGNQNIGVGDDLSINCARSSNQGIVQIFL